MKRHFVVALLICFIAGPALAAEVKLGWEFSDPSKVDGFRLYQRDGASYGDPVWEGKELFATVEVPDGDERAFVVRAFKVSALTGEIKESANSNEVFYLPEIETPQNLIIEAIDQIIVGWQALRDAVQGQVK